MKPKQILVLISLVACCSASLIGCSTEDNPVTPEKMQSIRKKQADEMGQLSKGGTPPSAPPNK